MISIFRPPSAGGGIGLTDYQRIVVVDAGGSGDFTTLSAALASITDASASNRYALQVIGEIAETAAIVPKSYVDVVAVGYARVTVTSTSGGTLIPGLLATNVVNATWRNINIVRAGTLTGAGNSNTDGALISNASPSTASAPHIVFVNCTIDNEIVGSGGVVHCTGMNLTGYASPALINTTVRGAAVQYGYGMLVNDDANPVVSGGTLQGGAATNSHGLLTTYNARGTFRNVHLKGGAGGTASAGLFTLRASAPRLIDCTYEAVVAGSNAILCQSDAQPRISGGQAIPAGAASGDYAVLLQQNCAPEMHGLHIVPREATIGIPYTVALSGRQQPSPSVQFQLVAINVNPITANVGVTVNIGTTAGGAEIATGIDIGTAGTYPITVLTTAAQAAFVAGTFFYITPSAAIADGSIEIHYVYAHAYTNGHGLYIDTAGKALISDCTVDVPGGSTAVFIFSNGRLNPNWTVATCTLRVRPLETGAATAVQADAAISNAPLHNCTFWAASGSNMTSYQAGTAHGSNIRRT